MAIFNEKVEMLVGQDNSQGNINYDEFVHLALSV